IRTKFANWRQLRLYQTSSNDDKIIDNHFYSTVPGGTMIVFNDMGGGSGEALILRNTIESISRSIFNGMEVRPGSGLNLLVADNIITADSMWIGLNVNFSNSTPANEKIVRNNSVEVFQWGVELARLEFARDILYCDNTFLGNGVVSRGIRTFSNASGTTLGLNRIEGTNVGLYFGGTGINMGDQVHRGNTWDGGFGTWAAEHTGFDFLTSRFFVNDDATNCGDPLYFPNDLGVPSVSPNSGWFINLTNGDCVDDCSQYQSSLALGNVYEKTVTGEGLDIGWTPSAHWAAQAYLYQKMTTGGETGLSASLLNNFEDQLEHTNIAQIQAYQLRSQEAMRGDAATREATREQYAAYTEALTAYISYLESLTESEIADPNSAASQQWAAHYLSFNAYIEERSDARNNALEQLIYEMDLVAPNLIEENWLIVNKLLLERERYGNLSTTDWATIEELASQCYDQYGPAVYTAQGMLPPCQWETVRERSMQACEGMERPGLPVVKVEQVKEQKFSVYPNPGNGEIQLQFKNEVQELDYIVVKNIYGQEILRQAASIYTIDATLLQQGVYYLEYWQENKLVSTIKFIRS
ncbi:MAG: T9SS type A sorting domain-containing protein, partial [Bacteroidota bacterium]